MTLLNIKLESGSIIFNYVLKYLSTFDSIFNLSADSIKKNTYNNIDIQYKIDYGKYKINFNDYVININYKKKGKPKGTYYNVSYYEAIFLKIEDENMNKDQLIKIIDKFIENAKEYSSKNDDDQISTKILKKSTWYLLSKLPKRNIDTIYLLFKDELIKDIKYFYENEEIYKKFGIPYKRNYLFFGPPGTGKTSIIFAIASYFSKNIYLISFSYETKDDDLMSAISNLPNDSILVLEDIDSLYVGREKTNNSNISYSCLLNFLDGNGRKYGLITFITTNFKDKLDDALIRPGRIDCEYEFEYPKENQIKEMFEKYFPDQINDFDKIFKKIKNKNISISNLQEFYFKKRNNIILDYIDKFINNFEKKNINKYNHIYA